MESQIDRFIRYASIDTQSDPNSDTTPSTEKQWVLARMLFEELSAMGLEEVSIDDHGYVMATLPSNLAIKVPTIGFISHYDTTPDFSGTNVKPRLIKNYDGKDIVLNKAKDIILSSAYFEDLLHYQGQDIIVTDGTTLLGADDKAGITEIMSALEYLLEHPEIKHGTIRVGFTPDEEIGRGAHKFDVEKFNCDWAYTMDGSQVGELEYENFNAAGAKITAVGKSVHPGYAKGKMVNAILLVSEFMNLLPTEEVPQNTEEREGFYHIHHIKGEIEKAELELIIRDHDKNLFEKRKAFLGELIEKLNTKHGDYLSIEIKDQYFNMSEMVKPVFHIVEIAKEAMESLGISPIIKPIRGGTDGSQLSFMDLPCPNIFAGGHNFHGKYEYLPVQSMEKATQVIVKICELVGAKGA
ncbi:peptidase T [Eudoraea sp.]|uniref:peptidase T n=1 Tax=Eudoraea sp. TaxID=1979955 RepID=UPI003C764AC0